MGYNGKILKIDLSNEKVTEEKENYADIMNFIGGKGLALKLLSDDLKRSDPLSSQNEIVFSAGPFVGDRNVANGGRFSIATFGMNGEKSVSSTGGLFGSTLKFIGYDAMIVTGRAQNNSYLIVKDNYVKINDASEFLGLKASECDEFYDIKSSVACIGPAGENLLPFASIVFDKHILASKNGIGAVMGGKNLKAIILKSDQKINNPCATCPVKCSKYNVFTGKPHWEEAGHTFIQDCGIVKTAEIEALINLCNDLGIDSLTAGTVVKCNLGSNAASINDVKIFLKEISYGKRNFTNCKEDKKQKYTDDPIKTILDSFGICAFAYKNLEMEDLVKIINTNTGSQLTKENILEMANKIDRLAKD